MTVKKRIGAVILWLLTALCMGFIFYMSSKSSHSSGQMSGALISRFSGWFVPGFRQLSSEQAKAFVESLQGIVRTFGHFAEFALLGFLMYGSMRSCMKGIKKLLLLTVGVGFLYAVSDEIHQLFVPGRSFQLKDILVDTGGVIVGAAFLMLILWIISKCKQKKKGSSNGTAT